MLIAGLVGAAVLFFILLVIEHSRVRNYQTLYIDAMSEVRELRQDLDHLLRQASPVFPISKNSADQIAELAVTFKSMGINSQKAALQILKHAEMMNGGDFLIQEEP